VLTFSKFLKIEFIKKTNPPNKNFKNVNNIKITLTKINEVIVGTKKLKFSKLKAINLVDKTIFIAVYELKK